MDRVNSRIPQAYGYAVCFITVIMMLISIKQVVDAAFDLSDPIHADGGGYGRSGRPITNFELYKVEARRQTGGRDQNAPTAPAVAPPKGVADTTSSDAELRKLYDAEREAAIGNARFRAIRSLVGNLLLIALAAVLFTIHWRWLRKRDASPAAA
ncbi:MAG TPA: hypothetical protein VGQ98_00175 [Gemmatimonadaceae bacterium]|nr:hypothetical protein [Gemmatimonadaceae bacterium]